MLVRPDPVGETSQFFGSPDGVSHGLSTGGCSLLPLEKFAVGGMYSVRGYRENQFVRDNGIASSIELRIPVIRYRRGEGLVQLAPFWDFGRSWNARNNTQYPYSISSMGLGIRWAIIKDINLQIYKGFPLKSIETSNNDLQGQGIHFRFNALLF